jgi:hypothetical protein
MPRNIAYWFVLSPIPFPCRLPTADCFLAEPQIGLRIKGKIQFTGMPQFRGAGSRDHGPVIGRINGAGEIDAHRIAPLHLSRLFLENAFESPPEQAIACHTTDQQNRSGIQLNPRFVSLSDKRIHDGRLIACDQIQRYL